jgi:predicted amidophosphoribosyltransferase
MNDDPVCQGCGTPLSDDETYACADCADWWAMMGHDIERREGDEAPEEP